MLNRYKVTNIILKIGVSFFLFLMLHVLLKGASASAGFNLKYSKYFFISASGTILLVYILLKCSEELKLNFVLLLLFTLIGMYTVECSLLLIHPIVKLKRNIRQVEGQSFDNRSKYQVLMDLKKQGIDACPIISPVNSIDSDGINYNGTKIFPLSSVSKKTTIFCNETGEYIIIKTDRYGFNNPDNYYDKTDKNIVLIGDSFAEGICVKPDQNIAGWLRKKDLNVINLGISGTGPLIQYAILTEYAKILKPKIVLWFYFEKNDLMNLSREKKSSFLLKYLNENYSQHLIYRQDEIDNALNKYVDEASKAYIKDAFNVEIANKENNWKLFFKLLKLTQLRYRLGIDRETIRYKEKLPEGFHESMKPDSLFDDVMYKSNKRVQSWGGQLYFVYLPSAERYFFKVKHDTFMHRADILSRVEKLGIPILDVHQWFMNNYDPQTLYPAVGAHYNSEGYRAVANYIEKYLRDRLLLEDRGA